MKKKSITTKPVSQTKNFDASKVKNLISRCAERIHAAEVVVQEQEALKAAHITAWLSAADEAVAAYIAATSASDWQDGQPDGWHVCINFSSSATGAVNSAKSGAKKYLVLPQHDASLCCAHRHGVGDTCGGGGFWDADNPLPAAHGAAVDKAVEIFRPGEPVNVAGACIYQELVGAKITW